MARAITKRTRAGIVCAGQARIVNVIDRPLAPHISDVEKIAIVTSVLLGVTDRHIRRVRVRKYTREVTQNVILVCVATHAV